MSSMLVVMPPGWTDFTEGWNNSSADAVHVSMLIRDQNWVDLQSVLQGADINPPEGTSALTGASLMALDDGTHLWAKYE